MVDGSIRRVHQEDACQALHVDIDADRGRGKYETAGGPSFVRIARLLRLHARDGEHEMEKLVRVMSFTTLIGHADAHGKNLSFIHDGEGHITLAPVYDTVPTMLWPKLRTSAAMSVNGRRDLPRITLTDIVAEARGWGPDPDRARAAAVDLAGSVSALASDCVTSDDLATRIVDRSVRLLAGGLD